MYKTVYNTLYNKVCISLYSKVCSAHKVSCQVYSMQKSVKYKKFNNKKNRNIYKYFKIKKFVSGVMYNVPCFMCPVSSVMCKVLHVACNLSPIACH